MTKLFPHLTILGITGTIGSGKSKVTEILAKHGASVIDCDKIVHELYEPSGMGTRKIQTFFGEEYLNKRGGVNRKKLLRTLIKFPKKWEILNRMIHPLVADQLQRRLRQIPKGIVALEIQIYTPKIFKNLVDEIWLIEASEKIRNKRLEKRKLKPEHIEAMNKQQSESEDLNTIRIQNNGSEKALQIQIKELLKERK